MNNTRFFSKVAAFIGLAFMTATSRGDSIIIQNPSFEALTGSNPAFFDSSGNLLPGHGSETVVNSGNSTVFETATPIPAWQVTGGAGGTFNYNGTSYFSPAASDGSNVAWANEYGSTHTSISQTTAATYQVGVAYELNVDVSYAIGVPKPGFTISLYAGTTLVASAIDSVSITPGTFSTVTLNASVNSGSDAVGQPISVVLASSGPAPKGTGVVFDNVRLSATTVPEPSTWVRAGIGLLGMVAAGRQVTRQ